MHAYNCVPLQQSIIHLYIIHFQSYTRGGGGGSGGLWRGQGGAALLGEICNITIILKARKQCTTAAFNHAPMIYLHAYGRAGR